MTHFPRTNANQRSPRVQLNGSVAAAVMAEGGQRARAKLQCISINGGLLQLQHELSTGDFVEIAFHTRSGAVHGMAEMLYPTRKFQSACLQPFRFIALADDDHRKLRMALDSALDRSFLDPVSEQIQTPPGF
jgi:(p)ppGpp synthase/HD superfamily hydrolase